MRKTASHAYLFIALRQKKRKHKNSSVNSKEKGTFTLIQRHRENSSRLIQIISSHIVFSLKITKKPKNIQISQKFIFKKKSLSLKTSIFVERLFQNFFFIINLLFHVNISKHLFSQKLKKYKNKFKKHFCHLAFILKYFQKIKNINKSISVFLPRTTRF